MSETYFPRQTCQMKMEMEETLVTSLRGHTLPARAALVQMQPGSEQARHSKQLSVWTQTDSQTVTTHHRVASSLRLSEPQLPYVQNDSHLWNELSST